MASSLLFYVVKKKKKKEITLGCGKKQLMTLLGPEFEVLSYVSIFFHQKTQAGLPDFCYAIALLENEILYNYRCKELILPLAHPMTLRADSTSQLVPTGSLPMSLTDGVSFFCWGTGQMGKGEGA